LHELLLDVHRAAHKWRAHKAHALPAIERDQWLAQYFEILACGFAAQAQAPPPVSSPKRGRPKQSAAKNLLDDLLQRAEQIIAFVDDVSLPFTNNQAERDFRMVKVQQKIAGTFHSPAGLTAFCRLRSYLSTMRKQDHPLFEAFIAVFMGHPVPVAWSF
jgi:transposase